MLKDFAVPRKWAVQGEGFQVFVPLPEDRGVGKNQSQETKAGTSKPAGKIVKTDQIPRQGSFPAVFPHHWNTGFRLIKQSREDMKQ